MNSREIKTKFDKLGFANKIADGHAYDSLELQDSSNVFLTKSSLGTPVILIEVDLVGPEKIPSIHLENIHINPAVVGVVGKRKGLCDYYLLEFKGLSSDLLRIFFEIASLIPDLIPHERTRLKIHKIVMSVVELFSDEYRESKKSVAGLWGELFLISEAEMIDEIVDSWHSVNSERFDFYFKNTVLDVKLSLNGTRTHSVSHSQLGTETSKRVYLASMITQESPSGKSLEELKDYIKSRTKTPQLKQKMTSLIAMTIGNQNLHLLQRRFDEDMARSSLRFFDVKDVPKVIGPLPAGISNLKYDVSLDLVSSEEVNLDDLV